MHDDNGRRVGLGYMHIPRPTCGPHMARYPFDFFGQPRLRKWIRPRGSGAFSAGNVVITRESAA